MCIRILQTAKQVNNEEYQFFLKGGIVLDRSSQPANPGPAWISELAWDNIVELENLPNFKGILSSFEQNVGGWEMWYRTAGGCWPGAVPGSTLEGTEEGGPGRPASRLMAVGAVWNRVCERGRWCGVWGGHREMGGGSEDGGQPQRGSRGR